MNKSLYHIATDYLQIADELIDNGGELTKEIETALVINKEELQVKAANYALIIKEIDGKADVIDNEIKRLTALKKSYSTASDRLKERIKAAMELYGIEKIESELIRLSFRESESVEIEDENLIPELYKETVETVKISKTDIKEVLKAGQEVPGACLKQNKNLQIK